MPDLARVTDEQLAELQRLEQQLPRDWRIAVRSYDYEEVIASGNSVIAAGLRYSDGSTLRRFFVAARNALPAVLAELRARRAAERQEMEDGHG